LIFGSFAVLFILINLAFPYRPGIEYSRLILTSDGTPLRGFLTSGDKWRFYCPLDEISDYQIKAVIAKEDKYFYYHPGVNPISILRAAAENISAGRIESGASTITMQVVRLLEKRPRTIFNKAIEALQALRLELAYSKDEILEMYLNLAPYGGNIEGVRAASILFFNKSSAQLSLAEAVTLSIVPNKPTTMALGRNNERLAGYRNEWLRKFRKDDVFDGDQIDAATAEKLRARRHKAPFIAPHLALRAFNDNPEKNVVRTSIIPDVQQRISNSLQKYIRNYNPHGVFNAAAVVIDNRTDRIIAYAGSQNFSDDAHYGQVDGVQALRSPGSTLKPLIYAIAIDRGILTPNRKIPDVPTDFGNYSPENFDESYSGYVSMAEALARSLNVPAVRTLDKIGVDTLINCLTRAGFSNINKNREKLGLSLALGGCGVTLEQLAGLYSAIANGGLYRPPTYIFGKISSDTVRLFSQEAAYIITQILTTPGRPDYPHSYHFAPEAVRIAWKTGTSYGRRDAWSIGFNSNYTIGVWAGNFDGTHSHILTGAEVATPLLFELFRFVDPSGNPPAQVRPRNILLRKVCQATGLPPGPHCNNLITDMYIPLVSTNTKCSHARQKWVSSDGAMSYCMSCLPESGARKELFEIHPPEIIAYYDENGIPYDKIPPHNPRCRSGAAASAPKILNPVNNLEYLLEKDASNKIMLKCAAAPDISEVHWFAANQLLASAGPSEKIFFRPESEGPLTIKCCDDKGRVSQITIKIKFY
jgi:penicillin-binding protein 1C